MDDAYSMFAQVGNILHTWEMCEFSLAQMYQIMCEADNLAPYRSYGALVSSNARFELLELAIAEYFHRPSALKSRALAAVKEARGHAAARNKVAHAALVPSIKKASLLWRTQPLPYQTRRFRGGEASYRLSERDLKGLLDALTLFSVNLSELRDELFAFDDRRHSQRARRRPARARKARIHPQ